MSTERATPEEPRVGKHIPGIPYPYGWPDVHSPEFAAEAHRQSLAIAQSPGEAENQAFVDSVSWLCTEDAEETWNP